MLLKNERHVLPLAKTIASIAVIGADAEEARLGGYSGPGTGKAATGMPLASASSKTRPKVSVRLGKTKRSAAA